MPIGKLQHQTLAIAENIPYGEEYIERCFFAWYDAGKPRGTRLRDCLPFDTETGIERKPNIALIARWKREKEWEKRAGELDTEARKIIERQSIEKRAEMFARHAEVGEILVESGVQYILDKGIDSPASAIRAIDLGRSMEERSAGVSEMLLKVSTMDNDQLLKLAGGLLGRVDSDDVIDGEIVEDEEELEEE